MPVDLIVAVPFWEPNSASKSFSTMYDQTWVEKLYRGFARNLTRPFEFVCFTDRERDFEEPITCRRLSSLRPTYADCLEPYSLGRPMILVGLDTIITGNLDHFADYATTAHHVALPRAVYAENTVCNGVALVPSGFGWIWDELTDRSHPQADMERLRGIDYRVLDDIFPGHAVSYKRDVMMNGLNDARLVFFHGALKPNELDENWIREHWR